MPKTHQLTGSVEYKIWAVAKERCYRINSPKYKTYGARGIAMSDDWRDSFESFIRDMGNRPSPHPIEGSYSIERIDNDGDYCAENCKWATRKEQANNTRTNRYITFRGVTLTLNQWAEKVGIKRETIAYRINKGWSIDEALHTPTDSFKRMITINGVTQSLADWGRSRGIDASTIHARLASGWSDEDAVMTEVHAISDYINR